MRAVSDERIGLLVESRADVSGFRQARQENSALAREAKAAAAQMAAGAQQGAAAQKTLASAAKAAADEQHKATLSVEDSRRLWSQAGGDYNRFLELIRQHVSEQKALTAATAAAAQAQQQQNAAIAAAPPAPPPGGGGPQLGPWSSGPMQGPALPPNPAPPVPADLDKIPNKARSATNALLGMAMAAQSGGGSVRGLAMAAGAAADGIASMSTSAKVAASAAGIGAIATVLATVVLLLQQTDEKAKEAGRTMATLASDMADNALDAQATIVEAQYNAQVRLVAQLQESRRFLGVNFGRELVRESEKLDALVDEREAVQEEQRRRRRAAGREDAAEHLREQERDAERSKQLLEELAEAHLDMYERRTQSAETAARLRVEREFSEQLREIEALQVQEDHKSELTAAAARVRAERLRQINAEARQRDLAESERHYAREAKVQEERLSRVADMMQQIMLTSILGEASFGKAFNTIVGGMIVKHLTMLAVQHSIDALADAAFGLWGKAAKHTAVAVAAGIGARKVAQIAGIGGGGESGLASAPSLSTQDPREGAGNVTVIVQTVDPTSREVIGQTAWALERSGIMKRPTNTPVIAAGPTLAGVYAG